MEQITENLYYQYFIGLSGFANEAPYVPSLLVEFRKRHDDDFVLQSVGIRLSGPALGRPGKNAMADKRTEYRDNAEGVETERAFSLAKRRYGLGKIMTKLGTMTRGSIVLSFLAMNVDRLVFLSIP